MYIPIISDLWEMTSIPAQRRLVEAKAKQYDQDRWRNQNAKPMEIKCACGGKATIMVAPDHTIMGRANCNKCGSLF